MDKPKRPFLRKGGGHTGRAMGRMHYPNLRTSSAPRPEWVDWNVAAQGTSQGQGASAVRDDQPLLESVRPTVALADARSDSNVPHHTPFADGSPATGAGGRPVTADSGCPDEAASAVLSPVTSLASRRESVVVDTSFLDHVSPTRSVASDRQSGVSNGPSVIVDTSQPSSFLPLRASSRRNGNTAHILGNSTAEFEQLEAEVYAVISDSRSDHLSDGTDSLRCRRRIRGLNSYASDNKDCSSGLATPSLVPSSGASSVAAAEFAKSNGELRVRSGFETSAVDQNAAAGKDSSATGSTRQAVSKSNRGSRSSKGRLRHVSESQPCLSRMPGADGAPMLTAATSTQRNFPHSADQIVLPALRRAESTPLLEKSFEEDTPEVQILRQPAASDETHRRVPFPVRREGEMPARDVGSSDSVRLREECATKQLRDLIAYLDTASEEHRRRFAELEETLGVLRKENDNLRRERNDLRNKTSRLQSVCEQQKEQLSLQKETAALRTTDIETLRQQNAALSRHRSSESNEEEESAHGVPTAADHLRDLNRQQEQERIRQNSLIRSLRQTINQKEKVIKDLRKERENLKDLLLAANNTTAQMRGQRAKEVLELQALQRASNKAPVTTVSKKLDAVGSINRRLAEIRPNFTNGNSEAPQRNSNESGGSTTVDSDVAIVSDDRSPAVQPVSKTVRWNEPVVRELASSPFPNVPHFQAMGTSSNNAAGLLNADMYLVRTEESVFGRGSLYRSPSGECTVHTETRCGHGCHYYEYSNTDTRWVHRSKLYQVTYYGHKGATVVKVNGELATIRHFISGQLEVYRRTGEFTLVTPNGLRTELLKDASGNLRTEIFDSNGMVRVFGRNGEESSRRACETSCHRCDGSYVNVPPEDGSCEWRTVDYTLRRFKNGDVKVRLTLIDTTVSMLAMDVGTIKHHSPNGHSGDQKYCVEWGTVMRRKAREASSHVANILD